MAANSGGRSSDAGGGPVRHIPVLLREVLSALDPAEGKIILDGTFGAGGYTQAILERGANVIALDRDPTAIIGGQPMVAANGGRVGVKVGSERQDRYGRTLAHLYDSAGNNLEAQLLAEGYGQLVAITPNVSLVNCQREAERQARSARAGLWAQLRPLPARAVRSGGFVLLEGQVQRVERNRGGVWIELGNSVVLRIAPQVLDTFAAADLRDLQGKRIEARGWVVDRSRGGGLKVGQARWLLPLTHGAMLEVQR